MSNKETQIDNLVDLLDGYTVKGGHHLNVNVFTKETLLDAQAHPEKYQDLQIRVCGWNVLWNNMSKTEQDAYIFRAENITQ